MKMFLKKLMCLVIGQLICVFSLFAQENVKVTSIFQVKTDSVKNDQEFTIGGPNCPGCKGLFPYRTSPLILVDGLEVSSDVLAQLKPEKIKEFSVIKDANAIERYGIRGTNGVIVITSKLSKKGLKNMVKKAKKQPKTKECQHTTSGLTAVR